MPNVFMKGTGMMMQLYESGENYLEAILILERQGGPVRSVDVARFLGYSKPSVSRAMKILKEAGFIAMESYGTIELTDAGRDMAASVFERHQLITDYLIKSLRLDPAIAEKDACRIEHIISPETFEQMKMRLAEEEAKAAIEE